jgi:magnesium transporter
MYKLAGYNHDNSEVTTVQSLDEVDAFLKKYPVVWVDVVKPSKDEVEKLGEYFKFHKLAIEDCLQTSHRPKIDNFQDYFFLTLKTVKYEDRAETYQISMFVGEHYFVTIREREDGDLVNPIMERILLKNPNIMGSGSDYLCYLLVDRIVDEFLPILDKIDDIIEDIEAAIIAHPKRELLDQIVKVKRDLLLIRKAIFPTMELTLCIQRGDYPHITKKTLVYFNDIYDHVAEVIDLLETSRELISGAIDLHMSKTQNVINEVAKTFAMLSILLMWPTVVGAIYGMNFLDMPEYKWGIWGYVFALSLMAILMVFTWSYFKKRDWV